MAYDRSDPRQSLAPAGGPTRSAGANIAPQYFEFDKRSPTQETDQGSHLWWARSQSCLVNYARVVRADPLTRRGQLDEYVVLVPTRGSTAIATSGSQTVSVVGPVIVVMPPGDSAVTVDANTDVIRVFTTQTPELCELCDNNAVYATTDPNVAPFAAWPAPPDGHRIRVYPIDDVPVDQSRFGRIFRCSTIMVNYLNESNGPRDSSKLSPHHHDDFEQLSLQLAGDFVHHIRTPWTVDSSEWRDDEHQFCTTPSVTVIPPPAVHTSQAVGEGVNQLIDIFCPPRFDFSAKPGWVLNADEYPMAIA